MEKKVKCDKAVILAQAARFASKLAKINRILRGKLAELSHSSGKLCANCHEQTRVLASRGGRYTPPTLSRAASLRLPTACHGMPRGSSTTNISRRTLALWLRRRQ